MSRYLFDCTKQDNKAILSLTYVTDYELVIVNGKLHKLSWR